jgi:hypothetical protein
MSAISAITLTDNAGASNNRVFDPVSTSGGVARWTCKDSNTAAGRPTLQLTFDERKPNRATDRVKLSFSYPQEVLVDGVYVIENTARFTADIVVPSGLTDAERSKFSYLVMRSIASAPIFAAYEQLEAVY